MFIGHYGLALVAKKTNEEIKLGTSILVVQLLDLLWPVFTLLGWEKFSIDCDHWDKAKKFYRKYGCVTNESLG